VATVIAKLLHSVGASGHGGESTAARHPACSNGRVVETTLDGVSSLVLGGNSGTVSKVEGIGGHQGRHASGIAGILIRCVGSKHANVTDKGAQVRNFAHTALSRLAGIPSGKSAMSTVGGGRACNTQMVDSAHLSIPTGIERGAVRGRHRVTRGNEHICRSVADHCNKLHDGGIHARGCIEDRGPSLASGSTNSSAAGTTVLAMDGIVLRGLRVVLSATQGVSCVGVSRIIIIDITSRDDKALGYRGKLLIAG